MSTILRTCRRSVCRRGHGSVQCREVGARLSDLVWVPGQQGLLKLLRRRQRCARYIDLQKGFDLQRVDLKPGYHGNGLLDSGYRKDDSLLKLLDLLINSKNIV